MAAHRPTAETIGMFEEFIGEQVVIDVDAPYVFLGCLKAAGDKSLKLHEADVHDLRDSATTRELYVLESRLHGVRQNRRSVFVRLDRVVSISRLADVLE